MNDSYFYNMSRKLPKMINTLMEDWGSDEVIKAFDTDAEQLIRFIAREEFPNEYQLKKFCERFKLSYSTIQTWDVLHKL